MGRHTVTIASVAGLLVCLCTPQTTVRHTKTHPDTVHPSELSYPELDWEVPLGEPYRTTLDNGLRLYIAEDKSLPLVKFRAYLKAGDMLDPAGKEGLGSLACRLIRTGGTEAISAEVLDERLERYAISLSLSIDASELSVSASFLSEYTDTALAIMEQVLFHPAFEAERVDKERAIFIQSIRHRFDEPGPTLGSAYTKAMYPARANSRMATEESLGRITRDDLVAFHRRIFTTGNMIAAIAGDFDAEAMTGKLEKLFPPSRSDDTAGPAFPEVTVGPATKCLVVHKPISQAYVRMGLPFIQRPHPDYYPMSVLNEVLGGGGFSSRLATTVRSDEGLTYSIYSRAGSEYAMPATIYISFFTKTETVNRAIELSLREVEKLVKEGVSDEELGSAKKVLVDGLPSMFRSSYDIVSTYAWSEYAGRSPDHYAVYPEKIHAITHDSLKAVAAKYLNPGEFTFVIVGDTTQLFSPDTTSSFALRDLSPLRIVVPDTLPELYPDEDVPDTVTVP
jgi:zinc protease